MLGKITNFLQLLTNPRFHKYIAVFIALVQVALVGHAFASYQDGCIDINTAYGDAEILRESIDDSGAPAFDNQGFSSTTAISNLTSWVSFVGGAEVGCNYLAVQEQYGDETPGGLIGAIDSMNASLLSQPPAVNNVAHLQSEWVPGANVDTNSVYAQDGFSYLQSLNIVDLWDSMRLIAYSLFVIVLIVAGFMIMFRQKIGGQVAITVFNTIPRVIAGLILVTFSFAIAGLIIDFGAVLMSIVSSIFNIGSNGYVITNPFSLASVLIYGYDGEFDFTALIAGGIGGSATLIGLVISSLSALAIAGPLLLLVLLFFFGVLAYVSVKVYITLVKAYIGILIDVIIGPILIAIAVIPGKDNIGKNWFNRIVKNVLTFVLVYALINLGSYIVSSGVDLSFPTGLSTGSLDPSSQSFSILDGFLRLIIPLWLYFLASEAPNILEDIIPTNPGKGTSTAIGNTQKAIGKVPILGSVLG